jgi:hypothetical protein
MLCTCFIRFIMRANAPSYGPVTLLTSVRLAEECSALNHQRSMTGPNLTLI